jgi:hypothetical protein
MAAMSIAIRCRAALAFAGPRRGLRQSEGLQKAHPVGVPFVVFGNALYGSNLRLPCI